MLHSDIVRIAAKNGWHVKLTLSQNGKRYYDFYRQTLGGVPFCFTAEITDGQVITLVDEIISFVDALDPERYAGEWLEISGKTSPNRYSQAVADMDDIRIRAWLLAIDLSEIAEKPDRFFDFPWYCWN